MNYPTCWKLQTLRASGGLLELEEAYRLGMFECRELGLQAGTQYFDGKKLVRAR